jgi:hypothetical protein
MITAARLEAENEHGRELSQKQWKVVFNRFPNGPWLADIATTLNLHGIIDRQCVSHSGVIDLLDPLVSVDAFAYRKKDGSTVTLVENTDYIVDTDRHPGVIMPAPGTQWPSVDLWPSSAVQITFTAGMTPGTVSSTIKQGMLLLVSQWYEGRIPFEAIRFVAELPFSVSSLFRNNKLWRF